MFFTFLKRKEILKAYFKFTRKKFKITNKLRRFPTTYFRKLYLKVLTIMQKTDRETALKILNAASKHK